MDTAVPEAPRALAYLTVQDMLWVNLQLTKVSNPFHFDLLEEATFYQYGYGESHNVIAQAARFLTGFAKKRPFHGKGDAETALIGCVAFLAMNGYHLELPASEAKAWLTRVLDGQVGAEGAINQLAHADTGHHSREPADCLRDALAAYGPFLTN